MISGLTDTALRYGLNLLLVLDILELEEVINSFEYVISVVYPLTWASFGLEYFLSYYLPHPAYLVDSLPLLSEYQKRSLGDTHIEHGPVASILIRMVG